MYRGRIVELAAAERLFTAPAHSYTQALLSAVPRVDPADRTVRVLFAHDAYTPMPLREISPDHFAAIT
jgi:oligopeptide/dipeptide ABC transporter ATP-binding protein